MDFNFGNSADLAGKKCVKCENDAKFTGIDPKKAWYCQECFLQMVRNKFRSALSKKKIYKDADSRDTLVVFDGTPSAAFLLNQIDDALKQITYKRLMIKPTILVLISVTEPDEIQLVRDRVEEIKKSLLEKVQWVVVHVSCSMYTPENSLVVDYNACNGLEKISEYLNLLASCSVPTYRRELKRILKEKCLRNISKALSIPKCMIPDDADDLGRLAIDQLCLGRGGSLSSLVSITEKRPDFMLIRPLRDVSKKELGIYNYLCGIDKQCIQISSSTPLEKSVQTLTDAFIRTLEEEKFYSTINTVMSTAVKIHNNIEGSTDSVKCILCQIENANTSPFCSTCSAIQNSCSSDLQRF